jgi:hypothetical protein
MKGGRLASATLVALTPTNTPKEAPMNEPTPAAVIADLKKLMADLGGRTAANHAAIRGLLLSHPDRGAAQQAVAHELELIAAPALAMTVSDAWLRGFEAGRRALMPPTQDGQPHSS